MSDDFAERVARRRLAEIDAGRAHAAAAWKSAQADNDEFSAVEAYKMIAEFNNEETQVRRDYQQHVNENTPRQQPTLSQGERIERFGKTDNPDWRDALAVCNQGSQNPISEEEYAQGYYRMKANQSTRGTEQK